MTWFRNFTAPLWGLFAGNLLLLICILFYLAWWIVSFRPNSSSGGPSGTFFILSAFVAGITAVVLTTGGISALSQDSVGSPVKLILLGAVALFFVLLLVTTVVFHRVVTSELLLIHAWAAMELSAIAALFVSGHLSPGLTGFLTVLAGIAFIVSIICYVLYYRLDETASYRVGMIPLISAAFFMAVFLAVNIWQGRSR